ncbi:MULTISPECIES: serine kinase [unclassified Spirosoma]|uniref:serine kinase n=1 Tax=unclassified Spirosoma TaxID=2621999 RepID=UPI000964F7C4|nr:MULTISPECIES: serine kinase [unclassified Spirosoma]MBN8825985.1 serine kinase [Spirosoma sp.]OJW71015.1 MAG: serine kinase [Spirosoma sp. 48-14]
MNYFTFGLTIQTAINFDGVLQPSNASADVTITEGAVPEKAGQLTRVQRRGVRAKFGRTADAIIINWDGIGKFRISDGNQIVYQNLGADEGTLRLFLLSEVFGVILYQRGLFLLHASAVDVNNQAIVFMGIPGAGKSTTATAFGKAGYTVLSDDLVAIQLIDNKAYVIPAFSQYKVWRQALNGLAIDASALSPSFEGAAKFLITQPLDTFPKEPVPLRQINILFPPNSRVNEGQISAIRAPVELLRHFPIPVQLLTKPYLPQHFQQSLRIAQSASIHFMKRTKDFQALEAYVAELGAERVD